MTDRSWQLPLGDVVHASEAMRSIEQTLWSLQLGGMDRVYRLEGDPRHLSEEEVRRWIDESASLGFSSIQYVVDRRGKQAVVIDLAATNP